MTMTFKGKQVTLKGKKVSMTLISYFYSKGYNVVIVLIGAREL